MRIIKRIVLWGIVAIVLVLAGVFFWLRQSPPDEIRIATNYAAKIVCSNVFVAGRAVDDILATDVQAPGHPLFWYMQAEVDEGAGTVETSIAGLIGKGLAVDRQGVGCAAVPDGDIEKAIDHIGPSTSLPPHSPEVLWPRGAKVDAEDERISAILDDAEMTGSGMRAVVVVKNGRIVGERYGASFSLDSRLIGWSMTKTVNAALIGRMIREGNMVRGQDGLFGDWANDGRSKITIDNMLAMSPGLEFNEDYGNVSDVNRMLYLVPDMASFVASKPLEADPGETFNYSSGTATAVSRIWQDIFVDPAKAWDFPVKALFDQIGMRSVVFETDARGTFVGSSYLYANARDWARFGQFLQQRGVWDGRSLLPLGFVDWMVSPNPASMTAWGKHEYGNGMLWLRGPGPTTPEGEDPDKGFDLPEDTYWMLGHDGQTTTVIPSEGLVVVRLGLTPRSAGYYPQRMVRALVEALR